MSAHEVPITPITAQHAAIPHTTTVSNCTEPDPRLTQNSKDVEEERRPHAVAVATSALISTASAPPSLPPDFFAQFVSWKREVQALLHMPRYLFLVRHGESTANTNPEIYATVPDNKIPLSPTGDEQATLAGRHLKGLIGDKPVQFFVSPYLRCEMTFQKIREAFDPHQINVREDPRLREQEWGNYQDPKEMPAIIEQRRHVGSFYFRFPSGESGADVYDRVSQFLGTLLREMKKSCAPSVVVISHGITLRLLLMRYFHWTVEAFHDVWNPSNCEIVTLERPNNSPTFQLKTLIRSNTSKYIHEMPAEVPRPTDSPWIPAGNPTSSW
ncbi:omega-amidase NIT2 [Pelomyxa schiedti]|nr:omega-amidase NIT2 [Pelomyxa schiedti]